MNRLYIFIAFIVAQSFLHCIPLFAQTHLSSVEYWQPIAQLPTRPSDIASAFAATNEALFVSNNAGLLRSVDEGITWFPTTLYNSSPRYTVAASGRTIYAAPYISYDNGTTWSTLNIPISPSVAGTQFGQFIAGGSGGVVRFSADGKKIERILNNTTASISAFAMLDGIALFGTRAGTVLYTSNIFAESVTWGTANLPVESVYDMTLRTAGNGTVFACAATNQGVWYSSNFTTWQRSSLSDETYDLCRLGDIFFAGTAKNGVFRSTDNGVTWQQTSLKGLPINVMDSYNGRVFAGTMRNGIYYSDNAGNSWQAASVPEAPIFNGVASQTGSTSFIFSSEALYSSADNGRSWTRDTIPPALAYGQFLALSASKMICSTPSNGIFRSENGGKTWLPTTGATLSCGAPTAFGSSIFVPCRNSGIYRSQDNGATWTRVLTTSANIVQIFSSGTSLYVNDAFFGLLRSQDNGQTWLKINTNISQSPILNTPIGVQGNTILANTFVGLFLNATLVRSDDGGATWKSQATNVSNFQQFIASGRWWYGLRNFTDSSSKGVYISADTGRTWKIITTATVTNLALDENGYIFGLQGNMVMRSTRMAITSVSIERSNSSSDNPISSSSTPNPANDVINIMFTLPRLAFVNVALYTSLGTEVWHSESNTLSAGEQYIQIDTRTLPVGVYAYRLTVDGMSSVGKIMVMR